MTFLFLGFLDFVPGRCEDCVHLEPNCGALSPHLSCRAWDTHSFHALPLHLWNPQTGGCSLPWIHTKEQVSEGPSNSWDNHTLLLSRPHHTSHQPWPRLGGTKLPLLSLARTTLRSPVNGRGNLTTKLALCIHVFFSFSREEEGDKGIVI